MIIINLVALLIQAAWAAPTDYEVWLATTAARLTKTVEGKDDRSVVTLCRELGLGRSTFYRLKSGEFPIGPDVGYALAETLGVRAEWLLGYDVIRERFREPAAFQNIPGRGERIIRRFMVLMQRPPPVTCASSLTAMAEVLRRAGWTVVPPSGDKSAPD